MNPLIVTVGIVALGLLAGAFWLLRKAREVDASAELRDRLRVTGIDEIEPAPESAAIRNPVIRWICHLFWRTGVEVSPASVGRQLLLIAGVGVVIAVLRGPLVAVIGVVGALSLFYVVLASRAARRRIQIIEQLPGFLESVIRVLAAGNTLEESIAQASREAQAPVGPLFGSISRQVRLGAALDQVLGESGEMYRIRDLKVLALAASINRKYGGSMRGVLKSVITVIRQRASAAKELRALTAETRFSAFVLAAINLGLFTYFYLSSPGYYDQMIKDSSGRWILLGSGVFLVIGFIVMWRMLKSIDETES